MGLCGGRPHAGAREGGRAPGKKMQGKRGGEEQGKRLEGPECMRRERRQSIGQWSKRGGVRGRFAPSAPEILRPCAQEGPRAALQNWGGAQLVLSNPGKAHTNPGSMPLLEPGGQHTHAHTQRHTESRPRGAAGDGGGDTQAGAQKQGGGAARGRPPLQPPPRREGPQGARASAAASSRALLPPPWPVAPEGGGTGQTQPHVRGAPGPALDSTGRGARARAAKGRREPGRGQSEGARRTREGRHTTHHL
ncbi:MAG: hypothetical protein J3K34DRAFT_409156 [Monoraphidium minutum]|nr:MAG: hypothetical protein J3K34DRAFT_409156 [Monoraphidium minutum]